MVDKHQGISLPIGRRLIWTPIYWRQYGIPAIIGLAAALALVGLYLAIVTIAQGLGHALELLAQDRFFVAAIATGFGTQAGLYSYLRVGAHISNGTTPSTALAASGTGTSSVAMIACCLHHVTDVLPLLGLSGAAIFLSQYRVPFMLLGIAMNLVGIAVMVRLIRKTRAVEKTLRAACH